MRQLCGNLLSTFNPTLLKQWYLCGYLQKKSGLLKRWKQRFVILTKSGQLEAYESHERVANSNPAISLELY